MQTHIGCCTTHSDSNRWQTEPVGATSSYEGLTLSCGQPVYCLIVTTDPLAIGPPDGDKFRFCPSNVRTKALGLLMVALLCLDWVLLFALLCVCFEFCPSPLKSPNKCCFVLPCCCIADPDGRHGQAQPRGYPCVAWSCWHGMGPYILCSNRLDVCEVQDLLAQDQCPWPCLCRSPQHHQESIDPHEAQGFMPRQPRHPLCWWQCWWQWWCWLLSRRPSPQPGAAPVLV